MQVYDEEFLQQLAREISAWCKNITTIQAILQLLQYIQHNLHIYT